MKFIQQSPRTISIKLVVKKSRIISWSLIKEKKEVLIKKFIKIGYILILGILGIAAKIFFGNRGHQIIEKQSVTYKTNATQKQVYIIRCISNKEIIILANGTNKAGK